MAAAAAIEIHGRSETILDHLARLEFGDARAEQRSLA
jgi:hypothetical protein